MITTLYSKSSRFFSLRWKSQLLAIAVFFILGFNRLCVLIIPFRYLSKSYGQPCANHCFSLLISPQKTAKARQIGKIVRMMANNTPWQSQCLVQAMTAKTVLQAFDIPYVLFFGLANNNDNEKGNTLQAHAWLTARQVPVTGGYSWNSFSVIATFSSDNGITKKT